MQLRNRMISYGAALAVSIFTAPILAQPATPSVTMNWEKPGEIYKTDVTIQVCPEPPMRRGGVIHKQAHEALRNFKADYARLQPWFPYPRLSMAALEPPANGKTSWDFSLIDPIVLDFYEASEGRPIMLNMAIPDWLFKGPRHKYPDDPNQIDWGYELGPNVSTEFRDPTFKETAEYSRRIAEWYIKGGFTDEYGKRHDSGHNLKIDYWEVLNEQDMPGLGHDIDPVEYTALYDKVVGEIRKVDPSMKFSGLALADPGALNYFEYFLNTKNHKPGIPVDMVSFHRYITADPNKYPSRWQEEMFEDVDEFIDTIKKIATIRDRLSPATKLFVSEWGLFWGPELHRSINEHTIAGNPPKTSFEPIPNDYWQTGAAVWAYGYLGAIKEGVDLVAAAELVDYPDQLAGTNIIHWETGEPNAVYHVAKLLHDRLRQGDTFVETESSNEAIAAQGFSGAKGRTLLLINKSGEPQSLSMPIPSNGTMFSVSREKGDGSKGAPVSGEAITLDPYAVAVIQWPSMQ